MVLVVTSGDSGDSGDSGVVQCDSGDSGDSGDMVYSGDGEIVVTWGFSVGFRIGLVSAHHNSGDSGDK
jgi:hypothetical protein